jgi:hypothetical protein
MLGDFERNILHNETCAPGKSEGIREVIGHCDWDLAGVHFLVLSGFTNPQLADPHLFKVVAFHQ